MNKIQNIPTIIVFHCLKRVPLVKEMHLFSKPPLSALVVFQKN